MNMENEEIPPNGESWSFHELERRERTVEGQRNETI